MQSLRCLEILLTYARPEEIKSCDSLGVAPLSSTLFRTCSLDCFWYISFLMTGCMHSIVDSKILHEVSGVLYVLSELNRYLYFLESFMNLN